MPAESPESDRFFANIHVGSLQGSIPDICGIIKDLNCKAFKCGHGRNSSNFTDFETFF